MKWLLNVIAIFAVYERGYGQECQGALGMEEGRIPDHKITASSSYEPKSVGPQNARIRQEKNGGAWCPKAQISSEVREYLEVDLDRNHLITWTETQGRFGNGQGQEYAESFIIEYKRSSLHKWIMYRDTRGEKLLSGNTNTYLVVKQRLDLPFVASRVRFIPYSEHPRTVCMRVEVYGCEWEQNLVQYSAPEGEIKDGKHNLLDISYDGEINERYGVLRGGLGQLVDGLYGNDDYENIIEGVHIGTRWVGWNNQTIKALSRSVPGLSDEDLSVPLVFEFAEPRKFVSVHIHSNNMHTKGVQIFSSAHVEFSFNGRNYQTSTAIFFQPQINRARETARNVTIPLDNHVAKFVKIRLTFAAGWLLLSEVTFDSEPSGMENFTEYLFDLDEVEEPSSSSQVPPTTVNITRIDTHARKKVTPATSPISNTQAYIGLITGVLAMVISILLCTIFLMVRRGRKKVALLHKHTSLVSSSTKPGVAIKMNDIKTSLSTTPIINTTLSRTRFTFKNGSGPNGTVKGGVYRNTEESDSENSSVYHEPYKLLVPGKQDYSLLKKDKGEYADFKNFHAVDELKYIEPTFYNVASAGAVISPTKFASPINNVNSLENYYAATDIVKPERKEQHFTPGRFTSIRIPQGPPLEGVAQLLDFPRHRLRVLRKLGEGSFGMVHLCEAEGIPDFNGVSTYHKKQHLIVKSLRRGSSETIRQEFVRETSWLAGLRDSNLARVVGLCRQDEPMCTVIEHSELGELPQFLRQESALVEDGGSSLNYGSLLYLATQIASGMKYLESMELVHRDLAARNCVVDKSLTVKISDHAMYCDGYEKDYYISDTKCRLPIRWMSWENLLLGRQSTKSDVWSFGVTFWEILTLCSHQPFAELTDEQVIENANNWYQNKVNFLRHLSKPEICHRDVFDLLVECLRRNPDDRPRFSEIHLFLQRKNITFMAGGGKCK